MRVRVRVRVRVRARARVGVGVRIRAKCRVRAPARQQSMSGVCLASLGRSSSTSGESSSAGMAVLCPRSHTIARGVKPLLSATLTLAPSCRSECAASSWP